MGQQFRATEEGGREGRKLCASREKCETSVKEKCVLHWRESGDVAWSGDTEGKTGGGAKGRRVLDVKLRPWQRHGWRG